MKTSSLLIKKKIKEQNEKFRLFLVCKFCWLLFRYFKNFRDCFRVMRLTFSFKFLGRYAVSTGKYLLNFRRKVLPPSSGSCCPRTSNTHNNENVRSSTGFWITFKPLHWVKHLASTENFFQKTMEPESFYNISIIWQETSKLPWHSKQRRKQYEHSWYCPPEFSFCLLQACYRLPERRKSYGFTSNLTADGGFAVTKKELVMK
jgi:hypothetical protein